MLLILFSIVVNLPLQPLHTNWDMPSSSVIDTSRSLFILTAKSHFLESALKKFVQWVRCTVEQQIRQTIATAMVSLCWQPLTRVQLRHRYYTPCTRIGNDARRSICIIAMEWSDAGCGLCGRTKWPCLIYRLLEAYQYSTKQRWPVPYSFNRVLLLLYVQTRF